MQNKAHKASHLVFIVKIGVVIFAALSCLTVFGTAAFHFWRAQRVRDTTWFDIGSAYFLDTNDPKVIQARTAALYDNLTKFSVDELLRAKAQSNICTAVFCYGLPESKVRRDVDIAITEAQIKATRERDKKNIEIANNATWLSLGSAFISSLALVLSLATFLLKM